MADAKPRLALVDRAIAEQPEDTDAKNQALRRILTKHAPTIARLARAEERDALLQRVGAGAIDEISTLPALRASFEREEAKHVRGALGWGALWGAIGGFALAALAFTWLIDQNTRMAFERAQEATQQGALVGAAAANQDENRERSAPYTHGLREPGDAP